MSRPSTIDRLPKEIRQRISNLRDQGRTLDEIKAKLDELDLDQEISRSALGRHLKKQAQVAEQIRRSRQMAEAVSQQFGDANSSQVTRTNIELLHGLLMKFMIGDDDEGEVVLDAKEVMLAATAIERLTKASKLDVERELQIRKEAEKEAMKKAASIVEDAAKDKEKGLSKEMVNELKAKFLGVPNER